LAGIAKVAEGESIQEAETGEAVKAPWDRGNTDRAKDLAKSQCRKLHGKITDRESTNIGAAKSHGRQRNTAAEQTVVAAAWTTPFHSRSRAASGSEKTEKGIKTTKYT